MNLQAAHIRRFRSIEDVETTGFGAFNVLIGKNNSGKSNILSAINTFFGCIRNGNVVALDPPVGEEIDFFRRNTDAPIAITLVFALSPEDEEDIKQDIIGEAPQMRNAVEAINSSLRLRATVSITPPPNSFGFTSELTVESPVGDGSGLGPPATERTILSVSMQAGSELYNRSFRSRELEDNSRALLSLTRSRELRYVMDESEGSPRLPVEYLMRSSAYGLSRDLVPRVERIVDTATSYEEANRELQTLASSMREEANSIYQEPLQERIGTFTGDQDFVPNYVRSLLNKVSAIKVLYLRERRNPIGEEEARRLLELKVRRGGPEKLQHIQQTVETLMGVQIDAFQSESLSRRDETNAELDVDDFLVQVNGSGIREALRLVLDYEFEGPHILLVEEPEMHLHPALETDMMRYLKRISSTCQVFATTHSTNFLDTADMKNVYLVSKSDSTQVQLLTLEDAETQIPKELGIRLSSLFMFDRLVFVEGASDEDIFREWAPTLGINFSQANVGFVTMGGVTNFRHFAVEKVLSFLTKRQVKVWFLMDRDERDDEEIKKIQDELRDKAEVRFLKRREIENYLIVSRPIQEFIIARAEWHGTGADVPATTSDIDEQITQCAQNLKQMAIDKRVAKIICRPIHPSRRRLWGDEMSIRDRVAKELDEMVAQLEEAKGEVEDVVEEQSRMVESRWGSDKLAVVPGDELLDAVFQRYGMRFRKERDGAHLASLMRSNEIDQEIKDIIFAIGSGQS